MATYSIEDHKIELNDGFTELKVIRKSNEATVAIYGLSTAHRLKCENGDYDIQATEMPSGYHQTFDPAEDDSLLFTDSEGLGISDLRTVRSSFGYHLDICPIVMQAVDGELMVQSPCQSPCTVPYGDCVTITEI